MKLVVINYQLITHYNSVKEGGHSSINYLNSIEYKRRIEFYLEITEKTGISFKLQN